MAPSPLDQLSETQRRCLSLVSRGRRTKEIAKELGLAPNTVDTYLRQAIRTLGVATRFDAARLLEAAVSNPSQELRYQAPAIARPQGPAIEEAPGDEVIASLPGAVQERHPPFDPRGYPRPRERWRLFRGPWGRRNDLTIRQRLLWMAIGTVFVLLALFLGLAAVESLQTTLLVLRGDH